MDLNEITRIGICFEMNKKIHASAFKAEAPDL
jgi:hypothetical protein